MEFALPPDGWGVPVCVACLSADVDMWKGRPRETFRKTNARYTVRVRRTARVTHAARRHCVAGTFLGLQP